VARSDLRCSRSASRTPPPPTARPFGALTLIKDAQIAAAANVVPNLTINGNISGNGTILKGGVTLYVNSDNSSTFKGGYVDQSGTTFFGTFEGNVATLSDTPGSIPGLVATSDLGTGNTLIQPGTAIQYNSTSNVAAGAGSIDLRSNAMANYGILRMAADAPLSSFKVLIGNLGGPQDSSYFGLAGGNGFNGGGKNAGSAIIALNTVSTQALDMSKIGDGTVFLGSTQNGVGLNGSYNAATLGAGAGNAYRLGAGGSTLYVSSDLVNSNVLTNRPIGGTSLIVGLPHSGLNGDNISGANGRGQVVLMTANNYEGSTTVNRLSTLEFRGSLTTSGFDTWGTLTAGGLGGTFLDPAGSANFAPVTLRNTSELRFDNSTGLLATGKLEGYGGQGRWDDDTAIALNNSTIRLIGNRDIEVTETVGDVTVAKFGQFAVQRDLLNRTATLVIGGGIGTDITRTTNQVANTLAISGNNGTLQINPVSGGQLGSDERIKLFGGTGANGLTALGGVTNGMVAPWMVNGTDSQFLTYTTDNGFVNAGFDGIRTGVIANGTVASTERTFINAASTINGAGALVLDTYALRIDNTLTFVNNTTAAATDRIRVQSGGIISTGTTSLVPGIDVGPVAKELNIFNSGTFTIGAAANSTVGTGAPGTTSATTGQITNATHIIKQGGGTLVIDSPQASFNGNYIVNQGSIQFRSATVQANLGTNTGTTTITNMNAGTGGLVVINNHGGNLQLRADTANTVFNLGMVIGEGNPYAVLNNDRAVGAANALSILTGGIRFGGSPGEQGQTLLINNAANNVSVQVNGPLVLSAATMEGAPAYNYIFTQQPNLTVLGQVTGGATLVHTGGSQLELGNVANGINNFTGGLVNVQGTTLVRGTATAAGAFPAVGSTITNGGIGSGDVTLYGGALNLLNSFDNTATRQKYWIGNNATGNSLIVNGQSTINVDRNTGGTGSNKHMAFKDLTIGSTTLGVTGGNTYVLEINGATNLTGTPLFSISSAPLLLNGAINDGSGTVAGTQGQAIIEGNTGDLWINGASSTFGGLYAGTAGTNGLGVVVNGGLLRFGDVNSENPTLNLNTMLRGSTIRVNPTGDIIFSGTGGATPLLTFANGQIQQLSTATQLSRFRVNSATITGTNIDNWLSSDSSGVIALNVSNANAMDLGAIGNGTYFLGAGAAASYTANSFDRRCRQPLPDRWWHEHSDHGFHLSLERRSPDRHRFCALW